MYASVISYLWLPMYLELLLDKPIPLCGSSTHETVALWVMCVCVGGVSRVLHSCWSSGDNVLLSTVNALMVQKARNAEPGEDPGASSLQPNRDNRPESHREVLTATTLSVPEPICAAHTNHASAHLGLSTSENQWRVHVAFLFLSKLGQHLGCLHTVLCFRACY